MATADRGRRDDAGGASSVVSFDDVTKVYGASKVGVHELTFDVRRGEVFGLLGSNGAGKTTILRLLLDLLRPDKGAVSMFGHDVRREGPAARRRVGYLPGELSLYENLTGREMLDYLAALRGGLSWPAIAKHVDRFGASVDRPIRTLSRGNKQRLGLVQAVMSEPDLLILDEPTSGLDPLVQLQLQQHVREQADAGRTVLLSSHVLSEVAAIADRVAVVRDGRLIAVDDVDALRANAARHVEVRFARAVDPSVFADLPGVSDIAAHGETINMKITGKMDALVKELARYEVEAISAHEPDLEETFLAYYGTAAS